MYYTHNINTNIYVYDKIFKKNNIYQKNIFESKKYIFLMLIITFTKNNPKQGNFQSKVENRK